MGCVFQGYSDWLIKAYTSSGLLVDIRDASSYETGITGFLSCLREGGPGQRNVGGR